MYVFIYSTEHLHHFVQSFVDAGGKNGGGYCIVPGNVQRFAFESGKTPGG